MRQYAIIGLGSFGLRMLDKLSDLGAELIIADRDPDLIESHKDLAQAAYIFDAVNEEALRRIIPADLDACVVDLGSNIEATILVTNGLKKLGVKEIIVRADSDERGEILALVGATKIVYPEREAAARIVPLLLSPSLFSFMPIGPNLVMAEVRTPDRFVGMGLIETNMRQLHGINVIALRSEAASAYRYFSADYKLQAGDFLLVAGTEGDVMAFSGIQGRSSLFGSGELLKGLLKGRSGKDKNGPEN